MGARIAIVNYGMGNLRSVEKSFERVGCKPLLSSDPAALADADGLVLPGVGAFPKAMQRIGELGLAEPIRTAAAGGTPVLGLCLGMQLLFERSSELGGAEGLGLLDGEVDRLRAEGLKLPHIGWSPVAWERETPLTAGLADRTPFYFVHTFVARPSNDELIGSAEHGERFAAVVGRHPVYGTQFHPEKSSADGLRMLANFVSLCAPVGSSV
jgi:glutamine amidotransferase